MQLIADTAGYSKYVVSKTLNGKPGVSEATRQKILFVAKQLGYFKENSGENIQEDQYKSIHNGFVLVVMPNHRYQNVESNYWSKIFNGIIDELEDLGIGVVVISSQNNLSDSVKTSNLLGIITVGLVATEMLLQLSKHQVPFVMVDHEDPLIKADSIFMDNVDGVFKVTSHLIGLGHKELKFIGDINYSRSFYDRWIGFRTALEKHYDACNPKSCLLNMEYDDGTMLSMRFKKQLDQWRKKSVPLPSGFVCANDQIAEQIMAALQESGYSVPGDCSVTGFDNLDHVSSLSPPLSTVQVLKEAIGKRAVSKLFWRIRNVEYPAEKILVSCETIIRDSVGLPK
ncbi:LacI family transcriptional regulator [Evansella caseinilytica]|uniref:LacI family transcriptional regulator n=1 Tax=Evansella caseinilytica TaxID=1503961 RepID=A0A1H3RH58_9BACI|nr:LacI family transcriptional regulator [Evansella caseinilytica]